MAEWIMVAGKNNASTFQTKSDDYFVFSFDSIDTYNEEWNSTLSKYRQESGTEVSDHLTLHNEKFSLEGRVSNSPIEKFESNQVGYDSLGGIEASNNNTRTSQARLLLKQIRDARASITLVSEFEVMKDIVLTNVSFSQDSNTGEQLQFKLDFEKVRRASIALTTISISNSRVINKNVAGTTNSKNKASSTAETSLKTYRSKVVENSN
ncbi:phage baseplate protein [Sodalis sp. RH20]|uniref:phage baseplate protein n=1 Tax=unclassified Sodalis (in: enterobacteria) TaxID=2636512 RepID=UPI0039B696BC